MNQVLEVKVISPKEDFYIGPALSISSVNTGGKFDILPGHANFITYIQNQPITIRKPNQEELTFNFPLAIIYNLRDKVNIYTDIFLPSIDPT